MRKKLAAFSIACAVLFAETAAAFSVSAYDRTMPDNAAAAVSMRKETAGIAADDAQTENSGAEDSQKKSVTVKAYQITHDNVKVLLNVKKMDPSTATYYDLLGNLYLYDNEPDREELPEDTVFVSGWFLSTEGAEQVDRYGKLASDLDHSVYHMSKQLPVHYMKFEAGEGKILRTSGFPSYWGKTRQTADNEMIVPEKGTMSYYMPLAERDGYRFLGWYTEPEGGEQVDAITPISGAKEQTLYAHWVEDKYVSQRDYYIVSRYYDNYDDGIARLSDTVRVKKGEPYGKVFSGSSYAKTAKSVDQNEFAPGTAVSYDWYSEKEGGFVVDYNTQEIVPGDTAIYYRKGVYACHYLSFDAGEGELFWNVSSKSFSEGNVPAAKSCELTVMEDHPVGKLPSAENGTHAFLGWYTAPVGGTKYDNTTVYKEKGDQKLYAHWDEEGTTEAPKGIKVRVYNVSSNGDVKVSFDYRGEDCANYSELFYGKNSSSSYGTATQVAGQQKTPDGMCYQNGYFTAEQGGQQISLGEPLIKNEDHALYSRSDYVRICHVLFDPNGGKLVWNGSKSGRIYSNDRSLSNNEIAVTKGSTFGTLPMALNGTRRFLGWFTEPDGGEKLENGAYFNSNQDMTYYAHWDEEGTAEASDDVYMFCYTLNSNTSEYVLYGTYPLKKDATYSNAVLYAPNYYSSASSDTNIPEGKILKALWYTDPKEGFCANSSTDTIPDHDFAVYCRSEAVGYQLITFDPGEGDLSKYDESNESAGYAIVETTTRARSSSSTSTTTVRVPASNQIMVTEGNRYGNMMKAYHPDKIFLGWFTAPSGGTKVTEDTIFYGTSDLTLYAQWEDRTEQHETVTTTTDSSGTGTTSTTTVTSATLTSALTSSAKSTETTSAATTKTTTTATTASTAKATTTTTTATTKATTTTTTATTKATTITTTATTKATTSASTTPTETSGTTTEATTSASTTPTETSGTTTEATTSASTTPTETSGTTTEATTSAKITTTEAATTTEAITTTSEAVTEPEPLRGDVDGNGEVSVDDAQRTLLEYVRIMAGLTGNFSDVQKRAGDINGDDQISVDDAQMILLYYVNNTLSGKKVTWDELLNKAKPAASLPVPAKIAKRFSDR